MEIKPSPEIDGDVIYFDSNGLEVSRKEYQNNELIKTTSISTFVEIREFEADANTLYARIKLNYTYSSVVYDVNLGGKVELYYQDLYGIVGKDQLNLK